MDRNLPLFWDSKPVHTMTYFKPVFACIAAATTIAYTLYVMNGLQHLGLIPGWWWPAKYGYILLVSIPAIRSFWTKDTDDTITLYMAICMLLVTVKQVLY